MTRPRRRLAVLAAVVLAGAGTAAWALTGDDAGSVAVPTSVISAATTMGAVELEVGDLAAMRSFYTGALGLDVLAEDATSVSLGAGGEEIVVLRAASGAPASPADAGLYHVAILYPDGPTLARTLVSMFNTAGNYYGGSADHAVSEAFYFSDPEGNGLELYIDTPRETWEWEDGHVRMTTDPLDPNAFLAEHLDGTAADDASTGHVHLKVGDVATAREFYAETLGFAVTAEVPGAVFLAAGGYHHHLAANTWGSEGAGERPAGLGLGSFTIAVPAPADIDAAAERLDAAGHAYERTASGLSVADPWGTTVHLMAA